MLKNPLYTLKFFLAPILLPLSFYISLTHTNVLAFHTVFMVFGFIPLMDIIIPKSVINPIDLAEEKALKDKIIFDILVWVALPIQLFCLGFFLVHFKANYASVSVYTQIGWIAAMGICAGVLGINVGHELGHRIGSWQRYVGKALLWTSLRMHFYIEHNWGHHRDVSTPHDPASAQKNELVYTFIFKSLFKTWLNSWAIQKELLTKRKVGFFSIYNDVFFYTIIQWSTIFIVFMIFGVYTGVAYLMAMLGGMLLLELVNYIEHYGLRREKDEKGRYERTLPIHSWNSDHSFSGAALFNLSRHSDHHYIPGRTYQILRNYTTTPNMPTGYAGMILLSLIFPLWFFVMNKKVSEIAQQSNKDFSMDSY
jgi:alkane 1-monooxygenase